MTVFKSQPRKGFVFVETIMTLAIIAGSITAVLVLEQRILNRLVYSTNRIERLPLLQNMYLLAKKDELINKHEQEASSGGKEKELRVEKKYDELETTVIYEKLAIQPGSTLARFNGLYHERITAQWQQGNDTKLIDLHGYGFRMKEDKE